MTVIVHKEYEIILMLSLSKALVFYVAKSNLAIL
jgi:hypothetical protein